MKRLLSITSLLDSRPSWHPLAKEAFIVGLIGMLLLLEAGPLNAYTSIRVALDSNILVDGGRVIFAQGTGSLTVLDLETGEVLLRRKPEEAFSYSGNLQHSAYGVLMLAYDRIVLLDGSTFDPVWQAAQCYGAVADGEYVVSHNGDHTVSCRKVQSGQLCWSVDMEGGWHLLAANGKALVATPDIWRERSALLVLDLESGRKVLLQEAPPGVHWLQVYFDGKVIHMVDDRGIEKRDVEQNPGNLSTLDLQGKVVAKVDCRSREVVPNTKERWTGCFIWGDKYFSPKGHVQPVNARERKALVEYWRQRDSLSELLNGTVFWRQRDSLPELLPNGIIARFQRQDAVGETGQMLQMSMRNGMWKAYAAHLGQHGVVSQVSEAQGRLLLGSSEGHVECLDIEAGSPRWLYVFPVIRQTVTSSVPYGMPPYLTQQAAAYREGVGKMNVSWGSIPLPQGFDPATANWSQLRKAAEYAGRIVFDPKPDDPFPNLGWYHFWLAICALLPTIGASLLLIRFARRKAPNEAVPQPSKGRKPAFVPLAVWCLVLSVSPAIGLLQYGRVSHSWTLALKFLFAMAILGAVCGIGQLSFAKRWLAASVSSGILIGWVYLMRYPWWFA